MNKKVANDGITHINVYSKANTELGRFLSNFTRCPIETEDGNFNSIEGYWYWLSSKDDRLRAASGFNAKALGRLCGGKDWLEDDDFKRKICSAITAKLRSPQGIQILQDHRHLLHLPLDHYYVYGNKINRPKEGKWIIDHIATYLKENYG